MQEGRDAWLCPQCDPSPLKVKSGLCLHGNPEETESTSPQQSAIQSRQLHISFVSQSEYHILRRSTEWCPCPRSLLHTHTHTQTHTHTSTLTKQRDTSHTHTQASGVECVTYLCHLVRGHYLLSMQIYVGRHGDQQVISEACLEGCQRFVSTSETVRLSFTLPEHIG